MMHSGRYHGFFAPMFEDRVAEPAARKAQVARVPRAARSELSDTDDRSASGSHTRRLRLLILGGYGTFGGRLAELLCEEPAVSLVIAGRSRSKAAAFCRRLAPGAHREAIALDRDGDLQQQLEALAPDIVIDASGPFQLYGDDPYRLVKAAIAAGAHYLDLADGADFVRGITQFDDAAKVQGVAVLSGVSSFPVLTAAVVRQLARGLAHVDSITGGIAPSPYAGYGLNVIRAIAGYAGKPVALRRDGTQGTGLGIVEMRRYTVAPPGCVPLRPTEFALVDVPDLLLLADLWPEVRDIWMGAGPVPIVLQRMLRVFAKAVARGWLPSLVPFARMMFYAVNLIRWGEHRGGMFVEVRGRDAAGDARTHSWHLLAEGDDGPYIPSMATAAIVKRWLAGLVPLPGARAATQELELRDYEPFCNRRRIVWGARREAEQWPCATASEGRSLFARVLGRAFEGLPPALRLVHGNSPRLTLSGTAEVTRGNGVLAYLAARLFGLPRAGTNVPVDVTFERTRDGETWTRNFDGQVFSTTLFEGTGRFERLLCERFGPMVFAMAPVPDGNRLRLPLRGWRIFGMPLPLVLAPRGEVFETQRSGRFYFDVQIKLPFVGLLIRYAGSLEQCERTNRHVVRR